MDIKDLVQFFKSLADENRLKILMLLNEEETCACKLLENLDLSQSGLSYHMKILTDMGIVESKPNGKWVNYSINKKEYNNLVDDIYNLLK